MRRSAPDRIVARQAKQQGRARQAVQLAALREKARVNRQDAETARREAATLVKLLEHNGLPDLAFLTFRERLPWPLGRFGWRKVKRGAWRLGSVPRGTKFIATVYLLSDGRIGESSLTDATRYIRSYEELAGGWPEVVRLLRTKKLKLEGH